MSNHQEGPSGNTQRSSNDPLKTYDITNRGVNAQGNRYDSRIQPSGLGYRYFNKNGSWGYGNGDGSKYYDSGTGCTVYTAPNGVRYDKSNHREPQGSSHRMDTPSQPDGGDFYEYHPQSNTEKFENRDYAESTAKSRDVGQYHDDRPVPRGYSDRKEKSGQHDYMGGTQPGSSSVTGSPHEKSSANHENGGQEFRNDEHGAEYDEGQGHRDGEFGDEGEESEDSGSEDDVSEDYESGDDGDWDGEEDTYDYDYEGDY